MSNRRKLRKLSRGARAATRTAHAGETCAVHPNCCEPDDTSCTGCGSTAIAVYQAGRRRLPHCAEHERAMGLVAKGIGWLKPGGA